MIRNLSPNNAQFRAMEKDVEERHKRMTQQRQARPLLPLAIDPFALHFLSFFLVCHTHASSNLLKLFFFSVTMYCCLCLQIAERCRVKGNDAFKKGQYAEAYRAYTEGLESQKTSMALHGNAALASLKMGCLVQAIEHCDKVLQLDEFLHEGASRDPIVVKALQRRSSARLGLRHFTEAIRDLEDALAKQPGDAELQAQLTQARAEHAEHKKEQQVLRKVEKAAAESAAVGTFDPLGKKRQGTDVTARAVDESAAALDRLKRLEALTAALRRSTDAEPSTSASTPAEPAATTTTTTQAATKKKGAFAAVVPPTPAAAAKELAGLVRDHEDCGVYARQCGALPALAAIARDAAASAAERAAALGALEACCLNAKSAEEALWGKDCGLSAICVSLLTAAASAESSAPLEVAAAAANLLYLCAVEAPARKRLARDLGKPPSNIRRLLDLLPGAGAASAPTQAQLSVTAAVLALLGQTSVETEVRDAIRMELTAADGASSLQRLARSLQSTTPVIAERAASLLGNACADAEVRRNVCSAPGMLVTLLHCTQRPETLHTALAALVNCSLEATAVDQLVSLQAVPQLVKLLDEAPGKSRPRVWGILSRIARHADAPEIFRTSGLARRAVQAAGWGEGRTAVEAEELATIQDAAVRCLALLSSVTGTEYRTYLGAELGAIQALAALMRPTANASDALVSNAALCLSDLAREPGLLGQGLFAPEMVDDLCQVAHKRQKAPTAQKNAAIALARMAQHPPLLERLRDLRGLEMIASYVKI